jgi:hypothetical protein
MESKFKPTKAIYLRGAELKALVSGLDARYLIFRTTQLASLSPLFTSPDTLVFGFVFWLSSQ